MPRNIRKVIDDHFCTYNHIEDALDQYTDIQNKTLSYEYEGVPQQLLVAIIFGILNATIFNFGGVETSFLEVGFMVQSEFIIGIASYIAIYPIILMMGNSLITIINRYIDSPLIDAIDEFWLIHFNIYEASVKPPKVSTTDFTRYWLYQMWLNLDSDSELDRVIDEYLDWIVNTQACTESDIHEIPNHEVEELTRDMLNNPDFRTNIARERVKGIIRRIVEFEEGVSAYTRSEAFVSADYSDDNIDMVIEELNRAYQYGLDGAVAMLSRKLVENLIIDFYRKYGEKEAFTDGHRFKSLDKMVSQLSDDKNQLKSYTPLADEEFINKVSNVKDIGNHYVHNCDYLQQEEDLIELQKDLEAICKVIHRLDEKLEESDAEIEYTEE